MPCTRSRSSAAARLDTGAANGALDKPPALNAPPVPGRDPDVAGRAACMAEPYMELCIRDELFVMPLPLFIGMATVSIWLEEFFWPLGRDRGGDGCERHLRVTAAVSV